jgi:hypothetical protein
MPFPFIRYGQNPQAPETARGKATVFGFEDPEDIGIGAPSLGNLSTDNEYLHGVAVPHSVLVAQLGKDPAAWRTARVQVTNIGNLQTMTVPIVDLGPGRVPQRRGVAADFTQALDNAFNNQGGDAGNIFHTKILPNAGPDVLKDPGAFWAEQDQLNQQKPSIGGTSIVGPDISAGSGADVLAQGAGPSYLT